MKTCAVCNLKKELSEFHKDKSKKDGLRNECKICKNKQRKEHRGENREEYNRRQKEYRLNNYDRTKEYVEKNKEQKREYYEKNKEEINKKHKEYYKANREKLNQKHKEYKKERRKNDPDFKFKENLRTLNHQAIKKGYKSASSQELLGCTWEEAKIYIENQFLPGMTWENWTKNGWHLDHIKPIAAFTDLTDPEQQRQCCHHTNLRPMWAEDNLSKSSWWNGIKH